MSKQNNQPVRHVRVTIDDVAIKAGVSTATISRVLNNPGQVSHETAERVLEAVKELGYIPQAAARNLASRKTNTIGLLLPSIGEDFFGQMMRGVEAETAELGYDLLIATQPDAAGSTVKHLALGRHNTDGMLIFTGNIFESAVLPLYQEQFPLVLLYQSPPSDLKIPYVTVENKSGTQMMIDHLIEKHARKRIAFLRGPSDNEDSLWREKGYRESLRTHGIAADESLFALGDFVETTARDSVLKMIRAGIQFDAVFGGSDEGAYGALMALNEAGMSVPDRVSVTGFDDLSLARFMTPALTTIRAPTEQVGREAVKQLMKMIRGEEPEAVTLLPTEIVIRKSCGC